MIFGKHKKELEEAYSTISLLNSRLKCAENMCVDLSKQLTESEEKRKREIEVRIDAEAELSRFQIAASEQEKIRVTELRKKTKGKPTSEKVSKPKTARAKKGE